MIRTFKEERHEEKQTINHYRSRCNHCCCGCRADYFREEIADFIKTS
jgi:hypothetical protein